MKKAFSLFLVLSLMLVLAACGGTPASSTPPAASSAAPAVSSAAAGGDSTAAGTEVYAVAIYTQNLGSQSFVDVIDRGCKLAVEELGVKYSALEAVEVAAAADSLRAAIGQGANLVIGSAATFNEALIELAAEYPDVMFCAIDSDGTANADSIANMYEVTYKEHEAAFLQGAFCALMSKTGKVAQLQGQEGGTLDRFNAGFRCGVKYVLDTDPQTVVVGFSDVNKGYETATMLYDQGYDWLACCAGGSNLGAFQASEEQGGDKYVCGAADGQFHLMPSRIVASQVKTVNIVAYDVIKAVADGTFPGGSTVAFGIAEGGVNLIFTDQNDELLEMIPDDVMATIEQLREDITSGKLVIPSKPDDVAGFDARLEK